MYYLEHLNKEFYENFGKYDKYLIYGNSIVLSEKTNDLRFKQLDDMSIYERFKEIYIPPLTEMMKFTNEKMVQKENINIKLFDNSSLKYLGYSLIYFLNFNYKTSFEFTNRKYWNKRRKEILERDNNLCQLCLYRGVKIKAYLVHHIYSRKFLPELYFNPFNLITLCEGCHQCLFIILKENQQLLVKLTSH